MIYNRFDKKWDALQFLPGRGLQSAELNEVQSVLAEKINQLGASLMKEGNILKGIDPYVDSSGPTVTVSEGAIFIAGSVRTFPRQSISISGVGEEILGVLVEESVITSNDDPSLRDPAVGYDNYGEDGADRSIIDLTLVLNHADAKPLYTLMDGVVTVSHAKPEFSELQRLLARRTFDTSGDYLVDGGDVEVELHESDPLKGTIVLESFLAYLKGFETNKLAAQRRDIDLGVHTVDIEDELKTLVSGTSQYKLNSQPADSLVAVTALVESTFNLTKGISGGVDAIGVDRVVSIQTVVQGATTFTETADYLLDGNNIDWSPGGLEPLAGSTYDITVRHVVDLVEGVDVSLVHLDTGNGVREGHVDISSTSHTLVDGGVLNIDYKYRQGRIVFVGLNDSGEIQLIEGKPSNKPKPPLETQGLFRVANIFVPALYQGMAADDCVIDHLGIYRKTFKELVQLSTRVERLEHDFSLSLLDREAFGQEEVSDKLGVFTDNFSDSTKADHDYNKNGVQFDVGFNEKGMTLPFSPQMAELGLDEGNSTCQVDGNIATVSHSDGAFLDQNKATKSIPINPNSVPYDVAGIHLSPDFDSMPSISQRPVLRGSLPEVSGGPIVEKTARKFNKIQSPKAISKDQLNNVEGPFQGQKLNKGLASPAAPRPSENPDNHSIRSTANSLLGVQTQGNSIPFQRQKSILVTGYGWRPNEDNITVRVADKLVPLTPALGGQAGTNPNTAKADFIGRWWASLTIPAGVKAGLIEFLAEGEHSRGTATFYSQGHLKRAAVMKQAKPIQTNTNISKTTKSDVRKSDRPRWLDPVAETIIFSEDRFIKSIGIYFDGVDPNEPITCEIRNVVGGQPGPEILATSTLHGSTITGSADGSVETVFDLDSLMFAEKGVDYALVLVTPSDQFEVFIAKQGEADIATSEILQSQPYVGTFFKSENGSTFSAEPEIDLKFKLYGPNMNAGGTLLFTNVSGLNFNQYLLAITQIQPPGTSIDWEITFDNGSTWEPAELYNLTQVNSVKTQVNLRATLVASNSVAPAVNLTQVGLMGASYDSLGTYVTRNIDMSALPFDSVRVYLRGKPIPSGHSIVTYASFDDGTTWDALGAPVSTKVITSELTEWTYEIPSVSGIGKTGDQCRFRIDLETGGAVPVSVTSLLADLRMILL